MNKPYVCPILGVNISVTDMEQTVNYIAENLEELRGQYICVANVHTTVMACREEDYRKVQNGAAMALPDGKPLSVTSRHRGFRYAKRVAGPDLMPELFRLSEEKGWKHYFYGATQETLDKLRENLSVKYPKLQIAGMYSPPFRKLTEEEDKEDTERICEAKPDIVWVGLGAPKQEYWMAAHKDRIPALMIGVGAGFDFHAGTAKRAPRWIQEMSLEWLYRLVQNPKRLFKRYATTNFFYISRTLAESGKVKKQIRKEHPRVAIIGHKRIPSREGGIEVVVEELAVRYAERGWFVDAYNRSGYHVSGKEFHDVKYKNYKGVRIITIPTFRNGKLNAIVYSVLATVRALFSRYDVYHYHAEGPCIMLWLPRLFGKKIVATIHGLDWQRAKWGGFATRMLKHGEKNAARYADEVIVLSKSMQQYFLDNYGRKTLYIPNGISRPERVEAREMVEKWGISSYNYILFLARIVPEKGLHYLIDAYEKLDTDLKLVIAGGASNAEEYMDEIKKRVDADDNMIMTYFVQGRKLWELLSNAYVFVLPSDVEGMAISLLEAMSYGNCCVVSDIPENTEVVEDHAVIFRHSDPEDLREKLQDLIDHPEKAEEYRGKAADFILRKYDWDRCADDTLKVYRSVMK